MLICVEDPIVSDVHALESEDHFLTLGSEGDLEEHGCDFRSESEKRVFIESDFNKGSFIPWGVVEHQMEFFSQVRGERTDVIEF